MTSCSACSGRAGQGRVIAVQEQAGYRVLRKLCRVASILCIFFCSITVVIFLFLCCSVKLSSSQPMSFVFSSSSPHPTRAGGVGEQLHGSLLLAGAKPQHIFTEYCYLLWKLTLELYRLVNMTSDKFLCNLFCVLRVIPQDFHPSKIWQKQIKKLWKHDLNKIIAQKNVRNHPTYVEFKNKVIWKKH